MDEPYKRPTRADVEARIRAREGDRPPAEPAEHTAPKQQPAAEPAARTPPSRDGTRAAVRFGARVAAERRRRGWNSSKTAAATGVDMTQLARIERGATGLRLTIAAHIAAALGISLDGLLAPCPQCNDTPPHGFTCNACGADGGGRG